MRAISTILACLLLLGSIAQAQSDTQPPLPGADTDRGVDRGVGGGRGGAEQRDTGVCPPPAGAATEAPRDWSRDEEDMNNWLYVVDNGDIFEAQTERSGDIHFQGTADVATGDYFRGRFDGDPEDCHDLNYHQTLSGTVALNDMGPFDQVTLTAGVDNGVTGFGSDDSSGCWHEANPYLGVASRLGEDWLTAVTATGYLNPNDYAPDTWEVAAAARYVGDNAVGWWRPQAKVAVPVDNGDGFYLEGRVDPQIVLWEDSNLPLTFTFPVIVGIGMCDYYQHDQENDVYGQAGIHVELPMRFMGDQYGIWSLYGAADVIVRESDIVEGDRGFDNAENTVLIGTVGVRWLY